MATSRVYPNPRVGAVIVHEDRIIGEGYHAQAGGPHAEVVAIQAVSDPDLLPQATLYVSLEPCNHQGKTPPCTDLILQHKIPRVVIGMQDPNPQVSGKGIARLRAEGVEVILHYDPQPFERLNSVFVTNQTQQRPYIVLKWAVSDNGYIAGMDEQGNPYQVAITGRRVKEQVHALRAYHHAILIGKTTAQIDDPQLTTRYYYGEDPLRIIFDRQLGLSEELQVFSDGGQTIVLNERRDTIEGNITFFRPAQWSNMTELCKELYTKFQICSILVEGGTLVLQQFIDQKAFDELYLFQGKTHIRYGVPAPVLGDHFAFDRIIEMGDDRLLYNKR